MKKVLYALMLAGLLALPVVSFATTETTIPETITSFGQLLAALDKIANWIFSILLIVAVIFILIAAFKFVTAGGNASSVGEARTMLLYAAVGIVVAVAAKGIVIVAASILQ